MYRVIMEHPSKEPTLVYDGQDSVMASKLGNIFASLGKLQVILNTRTQELSSTSANTQKQLDLLDGIIGLVEADGLDLTLIVSLDTNKD